MTKSDKWCLIRLEFFGEFFLNEGDTTIGRNKVADVITPSSICSRNHCVLTLSPDGNIRIKNQSSNGTYVNDKKVENEPCDLKHNDIIGLGCEQSVFNFVEADEKSKYYVFRLFNKSLVREGGVIDLVSDDDDDLKSIQIAANAEANPPSMVEENNDDNELIYSQQVFMEIKQEVNCPNEIVDHEDDFSIYISDDSGDAESNSWVDRLSQDQDLVVKKVTESVQNKKRKITKQIEAIPIVPTKKTRRNPMSSPTKATAVQKPKRGDKIPKASDKMSAETPKSSKNDTVEDQFVDRFDPFARKPKKQEKSLSFEDALLKPTTIKPKKKRIAHIPSKNDKDISPILRLTNGSWPSEGKRNKIDLRVRFADDAPSIREYEPEDDEIRDILIASPAKPSPIKMHQTEQMNSFENDPLHEIITDITEWKPEWIAHRNITPPINGVNLIVCPLIDKYPSFDRYEKIVTPLLKHELWSSIQAENRKRNRFEVKINSMQLVKRANRKRYVFHVQVAIESASLKANVGDFVVVEGDRSPSFFAYVTSQRCTRSGYTKTTYLTMEASESVVKLKNGEATSLHITPIANIRTELKLFNAVFYLDRTPLKTLILDPSSYKEPVIPNRIKKFTYTGYDKLNAEQLNILKSVYNKTLNSSTSLSLIEGPPGTGKTRLIVSIILQMLFGQEMKQKLRILVLASSNAAVDIIARRLLHIREKMDKLPHKQKMMSIVRYGVLNSMHPDVQKIAAQNLSTTQILSPSKQCDTIKPMLAEEKRLQQQIEMLSKKENAKVTVVQDQIKNCEKRLNQIKETIERKNNEPNDHEGIFEVMANARIVCSTLSSSINLKQYIRYFDVCFIDEASQSTEPWTLVPLQYNIKSLILVGDSNQLSPVVLSPVCREKSFERSLFTRLFDSISIHGTVTTNTYAMTIQYRMHPDICAFSNAYFYQKRLTSAPITSQTNANFTLQPYSVFSLKCMQSNQDMINYYNIGEAEFLVTMLKVMIKHADPKIYSYGIITPYAKQRTEIQHLLTNSKTLANYEIPVNTIDSYQGQEKDVIILCTTRTSGVGFLANPQRLNVALTRAKKCSVICGNFTSISSIQVWRELLNDARRRKKYHEISERYNFKTIADLLIVKQPKPKPGTSNQA